MIVDFERDDLPAGRQFDVCIVGSGAAGLCLAHELMLSGRSVVLLEGGGLSKWERKSQALNRSYSEGRRFDGVHAGRFRAVGGSTLAWAGQVMELDALDFEGRDWVEGSAWPFSKAELQPYYRRAAELEGIAGLSDDEVLRLAALTGRELGVDFDVAFSRYCRERSFSRVFAETIASPALLLAAHANVCEILWAEDRTTVRAVRFRTVEGREGSCSADRFVFCLGGIESARFLLNQSHAPWNESRLVGRHFQDHIQCFAAEVRNADLTVPNWPYGPWKLMGKYLPKLKLSVGAQRRHNLLNASGMIEHSDGAWATLRTAAQLIAGPAHGVTPGDLARMAARAPGMLWHRARSRRSSNYVLPWAQTCLSVYCEQKPLSESRITLSNKRDRLGLRRAVVEWNVSDQEVETVRSYVALARSAFAAAGIGEVVPHKDLFTGRIADRFIDTFHHCGATRMGTTRHNGVVDPDLRLFGTENAYVCSSSVFPSSGFCVPTHTVIALAVRLAEHLSRISGMPDKPFSGRRLATPVA